MRRHVAVVALLLVLAAWWTGAAGQVAVDEGVAVAQAQELADGGGWTVDHPLLPVDPDGSAYPLRSATRTDDGFVPYAKHPLYPTLLSVADRLGGVHAMVGVSLVGTLLAAVSAAWLAARLDRRARIPTLYVTALASPLLFDGSLVIAHALGAAAVGLAAVALIRHETTDRTFSPWLLGVAPAVAVAVLLRAEAVLLVGAAAVVLGVSVLRSPSVRRVVPAAVVGAAGAGALLVDRAWSAAVLGVEVSIPPSPSAGDPFLAGRLAGLATTTLQASYAEASQDRLLQGAVVLLVLVVAAVRRGGDEERAARALAVVVALAAAGWAVAAPVSSVPGLLVAFPLLWSGLAVGGWRDQPVARALAATGAVFAVAVAATQYRQAGGFEWGARYVAVALPLVIPVAVVGIVRAAARVERSTLLAVGTALTVLTVGLSTMALRTTRELQHAASRFGERILELAPPSHLGPGDDDGRPIVISTDLSIPQVTWPQLAEARWLRVRDDGPVVVDGQDPRIAALLEAGVDRFTLLTLDLDRDRPLLGGAEVLEVREIGAWELVVVGTNIRSEVAVGG